MYTTAGVANNTEAYNTLATPRGGQYQLSLPDGTRVWLNAGSSIRYPVAFNGTERKVDITGEAYFEVATLRLRSGQKMPFIVQFSSAGREGTVEVLGTHFNVNAYDDEPALKTTLLEGKVKVSQSAIGNRQSAKNTERSVVLKPGEQAELARANSRFTIDDSRFTIHDNVDLNAITAWMHGQLSMKYTDVAAFMRQVSRWYDVDVIFEGEVPAMSFSGSISKTINLSLVLKALNDNGLHVSLVNGKLIVKK